MDQGGRGDLAQIGRVSIHHFSSAFLKKTEPFVGPIPHNRCMADLAEHDCVERAKNGDRAAIAELYKRYWRAARAAAYGVIGDLALAEDAASDAFYLALQGLADLSDPARFGPWLRTIVVRSARRVKAAETRHKGGEPKELPDTEAQSTVEQMEQRELASLMHQAVGRLPERLREAVSLFYFEGYKLQEAVAFLDVSVGTLKRRLHEARLRLRDAASAIVEGRRPMDPNQERVIQRLRDLLNLESEPDRDVLLEALHEAGKVHPFPRDLVVKFREFWQRRVQKRREADPARFEQLEGTLPGLMARWLGPSSRAADPEHPVGQVAHAIREALPDFRPWQPDISEAARAMLMGRFSIGLPPGLAEGVRGSYVHATRAWLIQKEDGQVCTTAQVMKEAPTRQEAHNLMQQGHCLSDALNLWWLDEGHMGLRSLEDLLRRLATAIVPGVQVQFATYEDLRFRAALQMQLGEISIPAAYGGVFESWPGIPEGVSTASVQLFLEAWATLRTGQAVELVDWAPLMKALKALKREPLQ